MWVTGRRMASQIGARYPLAWHLCAGWLQKVFRAVTLNQSNRRRHLALAVQYLFFFCFLLLVSFLFSFSTFDKGNLTDLSEEFSNNSLDVSQSQEKTAVDLFTGLQSRQPVSNQTGASVFLDGGGFNRSSGYLSSRLTGAYERSLHLCIIDLIILLRRNSCVSYGAS